MTKPNQINPIKASHPKSLSSKKIKNKPIMWKVSYLRRLECFCFFFSLEDRRRFFAPPFSSASTRAPAFDFSSASTRSPSFLRDSCSIASFASLTLALLLKRLIFLILLEAFLRDSTSKASNSDVVAVLCFLRFFFSGCYSTPKKTKNVRKVQIWRVHGQEKHKQTLTYDIPEDEDFV